MMRKISIKGLQFSFGRKSRERKAESTVSLEVNRDTEFQNIQHEHVPAAEESGPRNAAADETEPECDDDRADRRMEMHSSKTKSELPSKGIPHSLSSEIQVPRRKERGLFRTIGRKIRASFRRKRDSSSEENYVTATKTKKQKMKPASQRGIFSPVEKAVQSLNSEELSESSAIGVSVHPNPRSKQFISVPLGAEKRETHSSCSSDSCEHDNNLRCSKISVNIHSCDTSDSSDRNGHVVNLEKVSIEMNSLNIAEKPVNSDSTAAQNHTPRSAQRTPQKTPLRTPCVSLSRTNPKRMNNGQPQPSSSGAKARPLSDVQGLRAATNTSRPSSSNLEDSSKAPMVPPRPDLLSVLSSAGAASASVQQRNLNHAIFTHPSLGFGIGLTLNAEGCFEPYEASPTSPVYDEVKDVPKIWSLTKELLKLSRFGWYWGPLTRVEAEEKLSNQTNGAFLVRDSSDDRYLLSLSFRSNERTLHTRIEHCNGMFSFYAQPESEGYSSIVDLIEHSMTDSLTGVFCYSRARTPGSPSFPVRLTKPVSRFTQVRSLQYLCRFVIRQYTRLDHIQKLPLPNRIKGWLEENQY